MDKLIYAILFLIDIHSTSGKIIERNWKYASKNPKEVNVEPFMKRAVPVQVHSTTHHLFRRAGMEVTDIYPDYFLTTPPSAKLQPASLHRKRVARMDSEHDKDQPGTPHFTNLTSNECTDPVFNEKKFNCEGRDNGNYQNVYNCSFFYSCAYNQCCVVECPAGWHFNPDNRLCEKDYPCPTPPPNDPSTTEPTPTSPHPDDCDKEFTCVGKPDGNYANIHNCSTFYISRYEQCCLVTCPSPLTYNPHREVCDDHHSCIPCEVKATTTTKTTEAPPTEPPTTTTEPPTEPPTTTTTAKPTDPPITPKPPIACTRTGIFVHPDCDMFIRCVDVNGVIKAFIKKCPQGCYFDPWKMKCVKGKCPFWK